MEKQRKKTDWSIQDQPVYFFKSASPKNLTASHDTTESDTHANVLKLTRSIRRQIYTSDLVFAMSTCLDGNLPKKTKDVLSRIQARIENINKILYGGGQFVLAPRDLKKYNFIINQMKTTIIDISDDNKLGADFFNAVMLMVEEAYESVTQSKNKRLQHEWAMLRQSMGTFCSHVINEPDEFDPTWIGYKYESMGVALGYQFEKIIMA